MRNGSDDELERNVGGQYRMLAMYERFQHFSSTGNSKDESVGGVGTTKETGKKIENENSYNTRLIDETTKTQNDLPNIDNNAALMIQTIYNMIYHDINLA